MDKPSAPLRLAPLILLAAFLLLPGSLPGQARAQMSPAPPEHARSVKVAAREDTERKPVALVIGNESYTSSPLKNPANDARSMAATLRKLGFIVEERLNLGYTQFNEVIESFGNRLRPGGVVLFYYAGHGVQVGGSNYLLPVDAQLHAESEVRYKALDVGLVLAKMEQARSDVNIVILDACRDNPFNRSFRSANRGLASIDAPSGTIIAYATAPGRTASDGDGANGLYTSELVKALASPGQKVEDVFKRVLRSVREKSDGRQIPWLSSSFDGDFYFIPPLHGDEPLRGKGKGAEDTEKIAATGVPQQQPADTPTGMEFVKVPAGCFAMGSNEYNNEKPVHEVCLNGFTIGKHEVTQEQWKRVMGTNPSRFKQCGNDCPVEQVSWNDVQEFLRRLNARTGKNCRLPTEAQWEYAARSGGKNEPYSGGSYLDALGWHYGNSDYRTHSVGQRTANGLGINDMSGNVWEWVHDWYGEKYYAESPRKEPKGPGSGKYRVLRGGSWNYPEVNARTFTRYWNDPEVRNPNFGFRLVCD